VTARATGSYRPVVRIEEGTAADFVIGNLGHRSLTDYLGQPQLAEFVRLVNAGQEIAAAQQYQIVAGARLPECHFAVLLAQRFLA
jgi:hypothetical protein